MLELAIDASSALAIARLVRRDERVPAAGGARGALDVVDALLVARRELERREVALEGLLRVLELASRRGAATCR